MAEERKELAVVGGRDAECAAVRVKEREVVYAASPVCYKIRRFIEPERKSFPTTSALNLSVL
jgi:hypothetical protein